MTDPIRFHNLLAEAAFAADHGHDAKALVCLDEARNLVLPRIYERVPFGGRPEDDPTRSPADRAAWRVAR